MGTVTKSEAITLRTPFPEHQISKLPKPTKAQNEAVKANFKAGIRCELCKGWHHPDVVHLDYVGHAALTDRLLDVDPGWTWEPVAFGEDGLPAFDRTGGLWIRLTVGGMTRLGYGHAAVKPNADPGAREKEVIGDALRNAAMRFGAALDLWHKGDLHVDEGGGDEKTALIDNAQWALLVQTIEATGTNTQALCDAYEVASLKEMTADQYQDAKAILDKRLADKVNAAKGQAGFEGVSEDDITY
jgi:hypothetical protein